MKRIWEKFILWLNAIIFEVRPVETVNNEPYYTIAKQELGVYEIVGMEHNNRIQEYHATTSLKADSDEIPWCSSFVNWCMVQCGYPSTGSAMARSWLLWGTPELHPSIGSTVCVFWRGSRESRSGHVGFYAGESETAILVLGGNQSDKVSYDWYPKKQLLAYRRARI